MKVMVNCDDGICCDAELQRRVEGVLERVLERFGDQVSRVQAHLSDSGAGIPGRGDRICRLEALIGDSLPVSVSHRACTLAEAIHDAADQLGSFIVRALRQERALGCPQGD